MIPKNITKDHILQALAEIDRVNVPPGRSSTKYLIEHEGKIYPPKYVISLANKFANGEVHSPQLFNGGAESNKFSTNRGFKIIEKETGSTLNIKPSKPRERIPPPQIEQISIASTDKRKELIKILQNISWGTWEKIVLDEPE